MLAVAQCQILAMTDVLQLKPALEDESVLSRVRRTLEEWKPRYVKAIEPNIVIKGKHEQHRFDFVSYPKKTSTHNTVAVKILAPSYAPAWQADRYGFFVLDIEKTAYARWQRLALITKADLWSDSALQLVEKLSDQTLKMETDQEEEIETLLPKAMTHLSKAS